MSGLKLAALYGFYPHRLGFCGLQERSAKETLFRYLSGSKIPHQKIREILETFQGAFPYYDLIAKSNDISDPFDEQVVKAYWLGNPLLEKVSLGSLKKMILEKFAKPGLLSKESAQKKAKEIPLSSKAHHSFHVLVIGSVSGRITLKDRFLDICRVGWGKVKEYRKVKGENGVVIAYQPLKKEDERYCLGKTVDRFVFWDKNFIPEIKRGDRVATHWNHVVQVLSKRDLTNLYRYTQITLDSLNRSR